MENFIHSNITSWKTSSTATSHHGKLHPQQHVIMENFIHSNITSWKTSSNATQHHGKLHPQQHDIMENFIHSNMTSWKTSFTATSHHGKLYPQQHHLQQVNNNINNIYIETIKQHNSFSKSTRLATSVTASASKAITLSPQPQSYSTTVRIGSYIKNITY